MEILTKCEQKCFFLNLTNCTFNSKVRNVQYIVMQIKLFICRLKY
uniref:Uncharacterized protein n=1 Tax=Anguilla anguilla TaxID=7936 RepID=A0A0E9W9A4_ANGAN